MITKEEILNLLRNGSRIRYVPNKVSDIKGHPSERRLFVDRKQIFTYGECYEYGRLLSHLKEEGKIREETDNIDCLHYLLNE